MIPGHLPTIALPIILWKALNMRTRPILRRVFSLKPIPGYGLIFPGQMRIRSSIVALGLVLVLSSCDRPKKVLPDPLEAGWKGESVCELLEENDSLRVLRCTFPPGVGHEKHFHAAHFAYSVRGSRFRLEDADGIRELDFPTASSYYSEGVEWHTALNIGEDTAIVLIIEPK